MINMTEKELKAYYSEVSRSIICSAKKKKEFMKQLHNDIDLFIKENPEADIEEIKSCFGTAGTIAQSFIVNSNSAEIKKRLDVKKYIAIAVIAALLIYIAFVVISLIDVHIEAHGYIEEGMLTAKSILSEEVLL